MDEPLVYMQRRHRWMLAFQLFWAAIRGHTVTVEMSYGYPPVTHYVTGVHQPWYEML